MRVPASFLTSVVLALTVNRLGFEGLQRFEWVRVFFIRRLTVKAIPMVISEV